MTSVLNHRMVYLAAALLGMVFTASTVRAQDPVLEHRAQMHSGADEYYFFEDDRKHVLDYKTAHQVRICTGESRHLVPLKVTYDNESAMLGSNDCIRVEAKDVYLEPEERLDPNWVISAQVETM